MNDEHSDLESQFEEEPPMPGANQPAKGGRRKKLAIAVAVVISALVLVITAPLVVKKNEKGRVSSGSTSNFEDSNKDDNTESTLGTDSEKDEVGPTLEETEDQEDTEGKRTQAPSPSPTVASITSLQSACPANTTGDGITDWVEITDGIIGEEALDLSGVETAMSADGSIIAIGSDENSERAGHVRVYRKDGTTGFVQLGADIDGKQSLDRIGASIALDSKGMRLAVGGRFRKGEDGNGSSGHVRVMDYSESSGTWSQVGQEIYGKFDGRQSVSLSSDGNRLAVGTSAKNDTDTSHARVYELVDDSWINLGEEIYTASDADERSVSLSGDGKRLAIGAYKHQASSGDIDVGEVKIYEFDAIAKSWSQVGDGINGTVPHGWGAALSLSADGNRMAVGSPEENNSFLPLPGTTRIYDLAGSKWVQVGGDLEGGSSVALTRGGQRAVVGDNRGFSAGINAGYVNVYDFDTDREEWVLVGSKINGLRGEMLGVSVAVSADGTRVVASAPAHTTSTGEQFIGITRVFDLC